MGNACQRERDRTPNITNRCNVDQGDRVPIGDFCTILGPAGNSHRQEWCRKISDAQEWGDPQTINNNCSYNDCNKYQDIGAGCCRGCCGILGGGMSCKRLKFTGDPVQCCLQNYICHHLDESLCFSDTGRQNTCANGSGGSLNTRDITSDSCRDVLLQYCTGTLPDDNFGGGIGWTDRWTGGLNAESPCLRALRFNLSNIPCNQVLPPQPGKCRIGIAGDFNARGYYWGTQLLDQVLEEYQKAGFRIGAIPGSSEYNIFQDFLFENVCCPYPGLCASSLKSACATYTAQRISLNPELARWCGCYLPDGEYNNYSIRFDIPPQCTPMCNREGTIPIVGLNASAVDCTQDICLIDNITLNIVDSQIGGGIDFNQVCANCPDAQCTCIIGNTTIDIENSIISGNVIPVAQGCGNFSCTQSNPGSIGPLQLTVPCNTPAGFNPYTEYEREVAEAQERSRNYSLVGTLIVVLLAIIILFVLFYYLLPANPSPPAPNPRILTPADQANVQRADQFLRTLQVKNPGPLATILGPTNPNLANNLPVNTPLSNNLTSSNTLFNNVTSNDVRQNFLPAQRDTRNFLPADK